MYSQMPNNNINTLIQSTQSTQSTISTLSSHSTASSHSKLTTNRCNTNNPDKQTVNNNNNNNNDHSNNKSNNSNKQQQKRRHSPLYECYCQARVRSGYELTSLHLTDLPEGSVVTVEEIRANRARITTPIYGWISVISKFGVTVIMPLNKETAKIGGKVIYTKKHPNKKHKYIAINAKIIDYNQNYAMHKIQSKDGKQQWISLKDPNIHYIPKNNVSPASINPIKQTEAFFNQFFVIDYPQFKPRIIASDSNKSNKKKENGKYDDDKYEYKKESEESEEGLASKPKWGDAVNNGKGPKLSSQTIINNNNNNNKKKSRSKTRYTATTNNNNNNNNNENINRQKNKNKKRNNVKKLSVKHIKENNSKKEVENDEKEEYKKEDKSSIELKKKKEEEHRKKCEQEFIKKIKEIERRIIDHLHMRGYYEDHPDFWRYIAKAKELAIARAEKERQKVIKKQELENKTRNN